MSLRLRSKGLGRTIAQMIKVERGVSNRDGLLTRSLKNGADVGARIAEQVTHKDTGALSEAHIVTVDSETLTATISIDPSAVNPRGQRPAEYGIYEAARGDDHDFYAETLRVGEKDIVEAAEKTIVRGLF